MMHIEVIAFTEKISPDLGGTGYLPPNKEPSSVKTLLDDAIVRSREALNTSVWKVARRSVGWHQGKYTGYRWLTIHGKRLIRARELGGNRFWYFVAVNASEAVRILSRAIPLTGKD